MREQFNLAGDVRPVGSFQGRLNEECFSSDIACCRGERFQLYLSYTALWYSSLSVHQELDPCWWRYGERSRLLTFGTKLDNQFSIVFLCYIGPRGAFPSVSGAPHATSSECCTVYNFTWRKKEFSGNSFRLLLKLKQLIFCFAVKVCCHANVVMM